MIEYLYCLQYDAAASEKAPPIRDYSLESSESSTIVTAFTSKSIIAAIFGNGILPEIQLISAHPYTKQLYKAKHT